MSTYFCRYCGKEKDFEDRDYDFGLKLAEQASYIEEVTPYLICKACAEAALRKEQGDER